MIPLATIFLSVMSVRLKRWIQSTVGLTGREANAFMILLPTLFLIVFSEPLYRWLKQDNAPISIKETVYLDSLVNTMEKPVSKTNDVEPSLFNFDPNKAIQENLRTLGISASVSKRIIQYRAKGGIFRIKADLAKMYGLDSALYRKLIPYIDLPSQITLGNDITDKKETIVINYDLNLADSMDLQSVKGIGRVLAKRILKYRENLGGFVEQNQLSEVYGLDSLVLQEFERFYVETTFEPQKVKVNRATEKELDQHPYLSIRDAKAIITYRTQHGNYGSIDDLMKIKTLKESVVKKVAPYLSFE